MPYFYHDDLTSSNIITLNREESGHLVKTLRAKKGDKVQLIDGKGILASSQLLETAPKKVVCEIKKIDRISEPERKIHVFIAPPRHNIMSPLIKQCVELGVWSINLIECEFSVSKPKDKKDGFENEIITGAKQSGNPFFPKINPLVSFSDALNNCVFPKFYGAVPEEFVDPSKIDKSGDLSLWIGPEGGFSQKELDTLKKAGAQGITVGNWVLRVETALISLLGILNS